MGSEFRDSFFFCVPLGGTCLTKMTRFKDSDSVKGESGIVDSIVQTKTESIVEVHLRLKSHFLRPKVVPGHGWVR